MASIVQDILSSHLSRTPNDNCPIVVMTCGMAGSGKTTLAKAIHFIHPTFHRISGDEIIHQQHGIYGVDYPASTSLYAQYQDEQDEIYMSTFRNLLAKKVDIILERSFYAKEDREEFRKIAEDAGARVVLVFLRAKGEEGKILLWERICRRSEGVKTADSALDIDWETFEGYWAGFEDPVGEGEVVVDLM
ncbi:ATP/GTP-binding protein [Phaeosphaeria sp. MPI-PUGE-AT-0046c]|nr:ATP/GTP-binding protein [Phaeosphaeria sp. MPI-PUGE-AT-0046c]